MTAAGRNEERCEDCQRQSQNCRDAASGHVDPFPAESCNGMCEGAGNALHPTVSLDALAAKMIESGFSLPDLANLFADHSLACFAAKRSSEFRHIRERPVAPEARQPMGGCICHHPLPIDAVGLAPHPGPAQEQTA